MFTVSGRRGAECSLSVGGGGLSVHCQWRRRGAECSLSVGGGGLSGWGTVSQWGRRGAECSLSVQWGEEGG